MNKLLVIPILAIILIIVDLYAHSAIKIFFKNLSPRFLRIFAVGFWLVSLLSILGLFVYHFTGTTLLNFHQRSILMAFLFISYFSKGIIMMITFMGDIIEGMQNLFFNKKAVVSSENKKTGSEMTRGEFIKKAAVATAALPFTTLSFGVVNGVHNYRIVFKKIKLPHLPDSFHGIRIGQISDVHSGSFFDRKSVIGGIELLSQQKTDLIFFTGDLVNNETKEVNNYIDIFKKVKAPLGVFSTLGNHDYGNYRAWPSGKEKAQNLSDMHHAHKLLGWNLLNNENHIVEMGGEKLAILGVENWGTGRFPKYGKLGEAYAGAEDAAVKLLLSHDPSHWDAQVRPEFKDIDIMFAGHTHGFQFGIETANFRWSPSQYMYKQWADLYKKENQYLYVNRGFGFLGFPGRIGIEPEITIFELVKA